MYHLTENLSALMEQIPQDSIVSRTIYKDDALKAVLFGFAAGQALSEHTASQAAIIEIVKGEAVITLDSTTHELQAGAWLHMPPRLPHSVVAKSPLVMLLLLVNTP